MKAPRNRLLMAAIGVTVLPIVLLVSTVAHADPARPAPAAATPISLTNGFYVDPASTPAQWAAAHPSDGRAAAIKSKIANQPLARWFGSWSGDIGQATGAYVGAAAAAKKLPVLVAYNIPGRDACGGHSAGGAANQAAYDTWIAAFASGIGTRPALVVIEPDSLGDFGCMSQSAIDARNAMLRNALAQFHTKAPNTWTYLDAGNPGWTDAGTIAKRLNNAGVSQAHGFSLNISNFYAQAHNVDYGQSIAGSLSSQFHYTKPFVVDTSRDGKASNGQWCNPAGRKIGTTPQTLSGGAEMALWLKTPGESDGNCGVGTGTTAGQFAPDVAYKLIYGY